MPKNYHPAYDIKTCTWFEEETGLEAKSLRLLGVELHNNGYSNFRFVDYYPNGNYIAVRPGRESGMTRVVLPPSAQLSTERRPKYKSELKPAKKVGPPLASKDYAAPVKRPYIPKPRRSAEIYKRHEKILDLWAAGITGPEIGKQLGLSRPTSAAVFIAEYRKRHPDDPRAARRPKQRGWDHCNGPYQPYLSKGATDG